MEKIGEHPAMLKAVMSNEDDEEARNRTFSELKKHSLDLLYLLQSPKKNPSSLSQLNHFLSRSSPHTLQPFFDYTLFPLLLLLDAAVNCRSPSKVQGSAMGDLPKVTHTVSDIAAEGVLQCLEELLKKCHFGSVDQMVVVLKKFTYAAMLSPPESSEEFREGVFRCFRALLLCLHLCSNKSCSCKQVNGMPTLLARRDMQSILPAYDLETEECLLAFLHSQPASAAVGHWLSLLLKAADTEAVRGHRGSAKVRVEAFMTLRVLVAKVGTADVLAFFLPGVVSQFAKVLHVSKTMTSGAAGSVEAVDQAIRGLAEFLMIVLEDDANVSGLGIPENVSNGFDSNVHESAISFLEQLRHLPVKTQGHCEMVVENPSEEERHTDAPKGLLKQKESVNLGNMIGSFHVIRTKDWITETSAHVNKILSATFPHLRVHPAKKVRQGVLAAIQGLLTKCSCALKESRVMLLECLCVLVCDDSEEVSATAQVFLRYLFSSNKKQHFQCDFAEIFSRSIEKLPKVVLGSEESHSVSEVQKLLIVIYLSGPQLVADHLFQSPVTTCKFLDVFALCFSQNSAFIGSLDKLILARPSSSGYLHSLTEMRASIFTNENRPNIDAAPSEVSKFPSIQNKKALCPLENGHKEYELPRMPPWFVHVGSQKLYHALAGILRLVGLSLMADSRSNGSLSIIIDVPLGFIRKLVSEIRMKENCNESWKSWYNRTGSGQLVRQASTAVCLLNEIVFGVSGKLVGSFARIFPEFSLRWEEIERRGGHSDNLEPCNYEHAVPSASIWKISEQKVARSHLIDSLGSILHEYLSPELWSLPLDHKSFQQPDCEEDISLHFFHDAALLYQVIIDGIGIFSIFLGQNFSSCGFLHSSLYLLLENLICSNFQIRSSSDAILHVVSSACGYPTVGHLVLENSDYVTDSICRQLRHLDLNPHVPNVLAAMLSYIGVAQKILPLLDEAMRYVSLELEILGRHQHPDLTVPFLKAVAEITKTSKREACSLLPEAVSFFEHVKSKKFDVEMKTTRDSVCSESRHDNDIDVSPMESEECVYFGDIDISLEQWESILFGLNDFRRYRRTVGSIAGSCLTAATPLLTSLKQAACLVALDIVEDGILALEKVEAAFKHEKETKEAVKKVCSLCSFHSLGDSLDVSSSDEADENRLLPAMNKLWPFLVACMRNKNPLGVRRCAGVISNVVQICGGDFFSRRFYTDGPQFWKLLSTSPFQTKPISKEERPPLQLPYRRCTSEVSVAEVSNLKVQSAVLNMIADLSRDKRSASALEAVIKKVSGIVLGIACSGVVGLREASVNALVGLASIDPDLIWLLLADVYYSKKRYMPSLPPTRNLSEVPQILPPPSSPKGYLYVQYGGQSYGFDIDFSSVETVFKTLHSQAFTSQVYR